MPLPTDDNILEVNRITIWMKEFFIIAQIHNIGAAVSRWRSALSLSACLQEEEKIFVVHCNGCRNSVP